MIALAAIIPVLYLLFRDTKAKVFLKTTEFQDLPLEHKEARFGLIAVTSSMPNSVSTIALLLMSPFILMSPWLPWAERDGKQAKASLHGPAVNL